MKVYIVGRDCGDGSQAFLIAPTKEEALEWLGRSEEEAGSDGFYESGMFIETVMNVADDKLQESFHFDTDI